MTVEEEHQDILQDIEFGIIQVYQEKLDLVDAEVLTEIEALVPLWRRSAGENPLALSCERSCETGNGVCVSNVRVTIGAIGVRE
jgi:hypothetical protein